MSALRKQPSGPATRRLARHDVRRESASEAPARHDVRRESVGAYHDVRREPVGSFAGTLAPEAPVGTFGNVRRFRRQGAGTFAGDADLRRQGSFADADPAAA